MMRLLFLCLLLLPAATAVSEENEGSADGDLEGDGDDEDFPKMITVFPHKHAPDTNVDKATGEEDTMDQFTLIIIIVAVTVVTLSVATIVAIMLVRRHMNHRQQGIYSVPTEQDQKGFV